MLYNDFIRNFNVLTKLLKGKMMEQTAQPKDGDIMEIIRYCSRCDRNYKHMAGYNGAWWVYDNLQWHSCGKFGKAVKKSIINREDL